MGEHFKKFHACDTLQSNLVKENNDTFKETIYSG